MKICIIYHSYSGITRGIAERLKASCGGDLLEVKPRKDYNTLTAYTLGCRKAMNREADPVYPDSIDVSSYDLIVIGTPVWAWKATPVTNGAIAALKGCEGKIRRDLCDLRGQARRDRYRPERDPLCKGSTGRRREDLRQKRCRGSEKGRRSGVDH